MLYVGLEDPWSWNPRRPSKVPSLPGQAWGWAPGVSPANLAWAPRAASEADERRRREQTVELVWTGPSSEGTVLRRTDQALLGLIRSARRTLHMATFAAYKIPVLNEAMLAAARRGVEISLIFESPDATGKTGFAAIGAVGEELQALSTVYVWPSHASTTRWGARSMGSPNVLGPRSGT